MGREIKTGSTQVAEYRLPSVLGKKREIYIVRIAGKTNKLNSSQID